MTGAEGGGFNFASGPTHAMRPFSRIIAAWAKGAWPVPSIRVKFLRTLTCATREVANNSTRPGERRYFEFVRASSRILLARDGLKIPQEQKRER